MTDHPIIFSGPMIRALLEGRKTQTRRLLYVRTKRFMRATFMKEYEPGSCDRSAAGFPVDLGPGETWTLSGWERRKPGDRLWVRENWSHDAESLEDCRKAYEDMMPGGITFGPYYQATEAAPETLKWRPSIHMPRWASRITLQVCAIKIERVKIISERDAREEGVLYVPGHGEVAPVDLAEGYSNYLDCRMGYEMLWKTLHGEDAWDLNPWVVALTFKVYKCNIDQMGDHQRVTAQA